MPDSPLNPGRAISPRALLTGLLLGGVLGLSNLFVGLKAGWAVSVAFSACLLAFAGWRGLAAIGATSDELDILECNTVQTIASACAFAPTGLLVSAWPAWLLLGGDAHPVWLLLWSILAGLLGLLIVVPTERLFLEQEGLPFPGGQAVAETMRSLYRSGGEATRQARSFFLSLGFGAIVQWSISNQFGWWKLTRLPDPWIPGGQLFGRPFSAYTLGLDLSTVFFAAGALIGLPITTWMLVGSTLAYVVLPPLLVSAGQLEAVDPGAVRSGYALWAGAALMVSSALFTFLIQLPLLRSSFEALPALGKRSGLRGVLLGLGLAAGLVAVGRFGLGLSIHATLLALPLLVVFTLVCGRATGETDIAPVGALGKLGQLSYGLISPGQMAPNLMATGLATTGAASGSDWLLRRKAGLILGADPVQQRWAYALGVVAGSAMMVPAFLLLVPDASMLGTTAFPAPAAQVWARVAEIFATGPGGLGGPARAALLWASIGGVLLVLLRAVLREKGKWAPHPMGLGMGMILFWHNSLSFFLGALAVALWTRWRKDGATAHATPIAGGLIAGESLMGVLLALLVAIGWMAG